MTTTKERRYFAKVALIGCVVCKNNGFDDTPCEIHHIGNGTMGKRSNNKDVIPLCHIHHRTGGNGVAVHSGRESFEANFGTEQELLEQVKLCV